MSLSGEARQYLADDALSTGASASTIGDAYEYFLAHGLPDDMATLAAATFAKLSPTLDMLAREED